MLQQGPELTEDAPASADSESAEPENPSEMPEPPDVDMTETDVSDGSSEMRKFQLHWLQLHKWLKFDSKLNKMFCQVCIDAKLSNAMTLGTQKFRLITDLLSLTKHRHKVLIICCTNSRKNILLFGPYHCKNSGKKQCSTVFKMMGFKIIRRKNLLRKP